VHAFVLGRQIRDGVDLNGVVNLDRNLQISLIGICVKNASRTRERVFLRLIFASEIDVMTILIGTRERGANPYTLCADFYVP
jgi:hypothetical protein